MNLTDLSPAQLRKAAEIKERIDALNDELASLIGGTSAPAQASTSSNGAGRGGRRQMSAAGRARIAAAARARWAKIRAQKGGSPAAASAKGPKPKRTMSAAARAKIAAAARARWAKVRAAKGS